jgi:integrase
VQQEEATLSRLSLFGEVKTLRQALERYAEEESIKNEGSRWEQIRLKKFAREMHFIDTPLRDIKPADIAAWRDSLATSDGTIRREMGLLNAVFDVASREWGWLDSSPSKVVSKPPAPRPRNVIYTDAQVELICDKLTGPKESEVALAFRISLETGMRSGEILSLDWPQVDLQRRVVHLDKTKNGDSRDVPLSAKALALFESIGHRQGALFTITAASRDALFRKAKKAAGVTGLTFHDARATAITMLARKVDVLTLARIVGHRDVKSLMVYYRESAEDIAKRL